MRLAWSNGRLGKWDALNQATRHPCSFRGFQDSGDKICAQDTRDVGRTVPGPNRGVSKYCIRRGLIVCKASEATLRSEGARMLAEKALEVCSMLLPRSIRKSKPAHTQGCSHMLQSPFHVSLGNSDRTKSKLERTCASERKFSRHQEAESGLCLHEGGPSALQHIVHHIYRGRPPAWQAIFRAGAARSCAWPPQSRRLKLPHLQCKPSQPVSGRDWLVFALSQLHVQLRACMGGVLGQDHAIGQVFLRM